MLSVLKNSFVRFCIVGGINTAIDLAVFSLLFYGLDFPLLAANAIGFSAAVINSYLLNKFWTFGDASSHSVVKIAGFVLISTVGLAISSMVIWLLAGHIGPLLAKIAAIAMTIIWNYTASRMLVFRRSS